MPEIRALIADDSPDIRLMLRMRLDLDERFDVVGEATDGVEAVRSAGELRPDLLILDLGMPGMDGLEALTQIRDEHPKMKIAILSGFPAAQVEKRALALGADVYLEKIKSLDTLCDRLHALMQ